MIDEKLSKLQNQLLRKISQESKDADLKQMANDVLVGRADLRSALRRPELAETLSARVDIFANAYEQLSEKELTDLVSLSEEEVSQLVNTSGGRTQFVDDSRVTHQTDDEDLSDVSWISDS